MDKKMVLNIVDEEHKEKIISSKKSLIIYLDRLDSDEKFYIAHNKKIFGDLNISPFEINLEEFEKFESLHHITKEERKRRWGDKEKFYAHKIENFNLFDNEIEIKQELDKSTGLELIQKNVEDRIIASAVLIPGVTDLQGEYYEGSVVRKAAYYFMENYLTDMAHGIDIMHNGVVIPDAVKVIQSTVLDEEKNYEVEVSVTKSGHLSRQRKTVTYPKDTWLMYLRVVDDKIWEDTKSGDLTGLSIEGTSTVRKLKEFLKNEVNNVG